MEQLKSEEPVTGDTQTPDHRIRYFTTLEGCTDYIKNFNIKGGEWGWNDAEQKFTLVYRSQL